MAQRKVVNGYECADGYFNAVISDGSTWWYDWRNDKKWKPGIPPLPPEALGEVGGEAPAPDLGEWPGKVDVQRYELALDHLPSIGPAPVIDPAVNGALCKHAEIAPLLAELATLREQTRRRDAATDPPPVGVPVLALDRGGKYRWRTATYDIDATGGVYRDERTGFDARVVSWWPLPEVGDV